MSFLENMEQIRLKHNKTSCCFKHVMIGANFNFNQALLFFSFAFLPPSSFVCNPLWKSEYWRMCPNKLTTFLYIYFYFCGNLSTLK